MNPIQLHISTDLQQTSFSTHSVILFKIFSFYFWRFGVMVYLRGFFFFLPADKNHYVTLMQNKHKVADQSIQD